MSRYIDRNMNLSVRSSNNWRNWIAFRITISISDRFEPSFTNSSILRVLWGRRWDPYWIANYHQTFRRCRRNMITCYPLCIRVRSKASCIRIRLFRSVRSYRRLIICWVRRLRGIWTNCWNLMCSLHSRTCCWLIWLDIMICSRRSRQASLTIRMSTRAN